MKLGIIGLSQSGKSTIFEALTKNTIEVISISNKALGLAQKLKKIASKNVTDISQGK
jgi:adenylate kinase family enzyme